MKWKSDFLCGIKEIDDQHKELIDRFADIEAIISAEHSWSDAHYAFLSLSQFAKRHFDFEEGLMRLFALPGAEKHNKEHQHFLDKIADIQNNSIRAKVETEMIQFLYKYLQEHILGADRKDYIDFVLSIPQAVKSEIVPS
ncbi:MAG: bacteriohemerythrin [Georgfuchsia sp.]